MQPPTCCDCTNRQAPPSAAAGNSPAHTAAMPCVHSNHRATGLTICHVRLQRVGRDTSTNTGLAAAGSKRLPARGQPALYLRCGWVSSPMASDSRRTAVLTSSNCSALVADLVSLAASVISLSPGW